MHITFPRVACAGLLWVGGCATSLERPIIGRDGEPTTLAPYFHPRVSSRDLPKTDSECRDYLGRPPGRQDSLVMAVCHLNRSDWDSASGYARAFDSCSRGVVEYDIAVGKGLPKAERFETLQSLLDCSEDSRYREMIRGRSKLAHYE